MGSLSTMLDMHKVELGNLILLIVDKIQRVFYMNCFQEERTARMTRRCA